MRVHELAKLLDLTSKEVIKKLQDKGSDVKSHMSIVDEKLANDLLKGETKKTVPEKQTPAPKPIEPAASPVQEKPAVPPTAPGRPEPVKHAPVTATASAVLEPKPEVKPVQKENEPIAIEMPITVGALAQKIRVSVAELIKSLIGLGIFANVNQLLNEEIVWKVANALNIQIKKFEDEETKAILEPQEEDASKLSTRAPIVTLMGHVDHGKTSLLDAIRKTKVADTEVGRITQHIGAYVVDLQGKGHVTFLDTPGHEAFTAMRARGANVTDVVVLVVAADDSVMPQTVEAINHARAAGCPIVVAINKSDLPTANFQKVMGDLQKHGLMPEEWGGKTICVRVSAKTGQGINELLELLLLESEILELKANPNRPAQGIVMEARLTKGRGNVATVVVQNGTLRVGDLMVVGAFYGRIRALTNDRGKNVKEAGPSFAAEVLGLSGTPEAGESFIVVQDEKLARKIAEKRALEIRERAMKGIHPKHMSLEDLYSEVKEGRVKELKMIVKADVQGSVEALSSSLEQASTDQVSVRILHGGVGGINESDIMLAAASNAIVLGFHVKADDRAMQLSENEGVDVRFYNIIYEAIDDVRKAMEGMLEPTLKEVIEGKLVIRQVFSSSKIGTIGGAYVVKGKASRNNKIRVIRDNIVIHEGKFASLKRFKDDVREVLEGYDCGVVIEGFKELQENDIIEAFKIEKIATKLA